MSWQNVARLLCVLLTLSAAQECSYVAMADQVVATWGGASKMVNPSAGTVRNRPCDHGILAFIGLTGGDVLMEWSNMATAGREFIYEPTSSTEWVTFYFYATQSDATLTFRVGNEVGTTQTVTALGASTWLVQLNNRVEISSNADVLLSLGGDHGYMPLFPVAETVYGQCSRSCRLSIWGGDTTVPIERACTDGSVNSVQARKFSNVGNSKYGGATCKWTAGSGHRISGYAYDDGTTQESTAFVPPEYFAESFRAPAYMGYLLLISTGPAVCTHHPDSSSTIPAFSGASGVYHLRMAPYAKGSTESIHCDLPVTALGDVSCSSILTSESSACPTGSEMNIITAALPTTTTTTVTTVSLTHTTATNTTTTTATTSSSSSITTSATTTTASTTTTTSSSKSSTTTPTATMSTTSTTTTSSSSSSTATTSATTATTTVSTVSTSTTSTSTSTTSTSTTSTSMTTTSVTTTSMTMTSTSTTSTSMTSVTSTSTGTTTTTSASRTDTTTTLTDSTTMTTTNTSSVTSTTLSATSATSPAVANEELSAAALVNRAESLEAALLAALTLENLTSVTRRQDGLTIIAVKPDVAAMAATVDGLTLHVEGSGAAVTVPASLLHRAGLDAEGVVIAIAGFDLASENFTGNPREPEVQVAAVVNVNVLTLTGRRLHLSSLVDPIKIVLPVNHSAGVQCVYWDEDGSRWASEGMETGSTGEGFVECWSTHLTLFAAIFRGFVNTVACSQVSLLNADAIKELGKGDWHRTTGALAFGSLLGALALLLLVAAGLDCRRRTQGTRGNEHFLIPLQTEDEWQNEQGEQPQEDHTGEASEEWRGPCACAAGCVVAGTVRLIDWCRSSSALRDAVDEVFSRWVENFGEIRSVVESLTEGLDLCGHGLPRVVVLVHRLLRTTMVTSARRQAAASLGISWDVSALVMEHESMSEMAWAHRTRGLPDAVADATPDALQRGVSTATLEREAAWGQMHRDVEAKLDKIMEAAALWSSLPGTIWRLFLHQNPVCTCLVHCSFMTCKQRVLLFTVDVMGALMLATVFFSASGVPTKRGRSLECEFSNPGEFAGRIVAIGIGSALLAGFPAMLLDSLCTKDIKKLPYEGCPEWKRQLATWRIQDRAIWILGFLYVVVCAFFVSIFLTNVDNEDHGEWLLSILISLVQDLVLLPLTTALSLTLLTTACLQFISHRRRTTKEELISDLHLEFKQRVNMNVAAGTI